MWGGHAAQVWTDPGKARRRVVRSCAGWLALSPEHGWQRRSSVLSDGQGKRRCVPGSSWLVKFLVAVARKPWGEESRNRLLPHRFTKLGREWAKEAAKHASRHRVPKLDARFLADLKATEDGREGVVVLRIGEGDSYRGKVREWAHEHNVGVTTKMAQLEDYDVVFIDFWKRPDSEEEYEELLRQREQRYRERWERQCEEEDRYWWVAPRYTRGGHLGFVIDFGPPEDRKATFVDAEIIDLLPITKARTKYGAVTECRDDELARFFGEKNRKPSRL